MKKLLVLLALCMVISVALVACTGNGGEENTTPEVTTDPTTDPGSDSESEDPTTEEPTTEDPTTEDPTTEEPTTEEPTTEPPVVIDPVLTHISFDECDPWIGETQGTGFFAPAASAEWDKIAVVEDYNVQYIRVWGWVGFYAETIGEFGYQIGDAEPVYNSAFAWETEQAVVNAAAPTGAKSASRFKIMIPVEYLSGEGIVIKALAKDAVGTVETIAEFTLTKPVNPNAPVAFFSAADLAATIPGSPGVNSAVMSADGTYITIDTISQGDPYYQIPMLNGKGTVATHIAIKYRTASTYTASEAFIGSGANPNGQGDNIRFDLTCDDNWNLAIIDLSQVTAVVDGVVNYLRWDPFAGAADATIDLAYIGVYSNYEAAFAYDAQFEGIYRNVPNHQDVKVDLGIRTSGGPYSGVKTFGQKLPLGETFLKNITITNMATYSDGNTNTWALKIWAWNTDYATTVAGTPLYVVTGENHQDNQDFSVDIPAKLLISGDVYYELEYLTGSAQFTGWTADAILVEGVETYVAGALQEGTYASSVVVGVELPPVETIFYDGTNGTMDVPVQGVKYFVRGAAGQVMTITGAYNFVVTADNLMGSTVVLQPNMFGEIVVDVPADWFQFELTVDNVCGEPASFALSFETPAPEINTILTLGENLVTAIVTPSGYNDCYMYDFTAEAAGTYTFTLTADYAAGALWYFDAPYYGMVEGNVLSIALDAGQTITVGVSADVVMSDLVGATEDLYYNLGLVVAEGAAQPATQTATVVIGDYASANAWENSTLYAELQVNADVTVSLTATPASSYGQNTGKYYTSDTTWRIYQNEAPAITVTAAEGKTIVSVKVTYVSNKTGVLLNGDAQVETDAVIEVNANSITLGVGNTDSSVSNGQVRITAIEVIYG